jgi:hypothetical protein
LAKSEKILDYFFHLPTLITIAMFGIVLIWTVYDIGFSAGNGFFRLNSNQGNMSIYWVHGCCDIDW